MQNRILKEGPLLDENGSLTNPGWATDLILKYNRSEIKASKLRIKEWDYYCILDHRNRIGIALTIADNSYLGLVSATYFDFNKPVEITRTIMKPFTMGKFNMPSTSKEGNISIKLKETFIEFIKEGNERFLALEYPNFHEGNALSVKIKLHQPENIETMTIATPFKEDKKAFYYNQKINCMPAEGTISLGDSKIEIDNCSAFGVLDWGRGVWTYSNTWYWGSASGVLDNVPFGFNIGYGFGDTQKASENMVFYNNKVHKLDRVEFHIPDGSYLKPWKFSSNDGRFKMDFIPIIDRSAKTNLVLLKSVQHQVFGYFTGKVVLDDGNTIYIKNFLGFAEKVNNKW